MSSRRVLYISYDGVLEPLGESQVVAYVERLARHRPITLVSFEKDADLEDRFRSEAMRTRLDRAGVEWIPRRYHKRPQWLAKPLDALIGSWDSVRLAILHRCRIIHVRGYFAALMGLVGSKLGGARLIFDMRGFWPEEKVDSGEWPANGVAYRIAKWWERRFFESAHGIVSLTDAAVRSLSDLRYALRPNVSVRVIPTCVDLDRFARRSKDTELLETLGLGHGRVIGCIGTMTRRYMRTEMLEYLGIVARSDPDTRVMIVTRDDHEALREDAIRLGLDPKRLVLVRVEYADMPRFVRLLDLAVFFILPTYAARASAATKLGELLASGVPVVTNDIGDSVRFVRETRTGLVLDDLSRPALEASMSELARVLDDPNVPARCRETAARYFNLERGVAEYSQLYDAVT